MNEINPHSTRASEAIDEELVSGEIDFEQYYVSNGTRFANYLVDFTASAALILFLTFRALDNDPGLEQDESTFNIVAYLLIFGYYSLFEIFSQRTLGKIITGTKVVTIDGRKPSAGDILLRTLCRFVPFEAFSFFGDVNKGWHDKWSKTMVVKSSFNEVR